MRQLLARRRETGDDGAVLPIVALVLAALIASSALAIDIGHGQLLRRDLQKVSDAIALDMVRQLDGSAPSSFNDAAGANRTSWTTALAATEARNSFVPGANRTVTAVAGCWTASTQSWTAVDASCPAADSVKVVSGDTIDYWFYPGSGSSTRTSYASRTPSVDYQVGSFLAGASLNTNQVAVLNNVLARAFGNTNPLTVDALSYQGLANGTVSVRQIATAYGLGSPDQLFTGTVNTRRLIQAYADALSNNGGSSVTVTSLRNIAATVSNSSQTSFSGIVDPGTSVSGSSGSGSVLDSQMSVLGLLEATAFLMNGTNTISIPNLSVTIPNLASVSTNLKVIQKPIRVSNQKVGQVCQATSSCTSQLDLSVTTQFDIDASALLAGARLRGAITLRPQLGGAQTTPTAIRCAETANPGVTMSLAAQPITVTGSSAVTLSAQVLLSTIDVLSSTVSNAAISTTSSGGSASFADPSEFLPSTTKRIGSATLNLSGGLNATSANSTVLTVALPAATLISVVNNVLTTSVYPSIQNNLLPLLTQTLGLELGGGDVGIFDTACDGVTLAG